MRTLKCRSKKEPENRSLDLRDASYDMEEVNFYRTQTPVFS